MTGLLIRNSNDYLLDKYKRVRCTERIKPHLQTTAKLTEFNHFYKITDKVWLIKVTSRIVFVINLYKLIWSSSGKVSYCHYFSSVVVCFNLLIRTKRVPNVRSTSHMNSRCPKNNHNLSVSPLWWCTTVILLVRIKMLICILWLKKLFVYLYGDFIHILPSSMTAYPYLALN